MDTSDVFFIKVLNCTASRGIMRCIAWGRMTKRIVAL